MARSNAHSLVSVSWDFCTALGSSHKQLVVRVASIEVVQKPLNHRDKPDGCVWQQQITE